MNSNFSNNRTAREKREERDKVAREILGKFLYDMSKSTYTVLVLGACAALLGITNIDIEYPFITLLFGVASSASFAFIGNYILKHK